MIAPNYPPEKQKSAMPKRPNVIWVLADQLRAQALSCNGETNICTPNIDQLAMRGVNFTAAVSGYPLCCPLPRQHADRALPQPLHAGA